MTMPPSFDLVQWKESNPDAFKVYIGQQPSSWKAVGGSLAMLLQELDESVTDSKSDSETIKSVLVRIIAHSDCFTTKRVEGDISPSRWFNSLNQMAQQVLAGMPEKLHKISVNAGHSSEGLPGRRRRGSTDSISSVSSFKGGGSSSSNRSTKRNQQAYIPYCSTKSAKEVQEVLGSSKRFNPFTESQVRLVAMLIQSDCVDEYLKREFIEQGGLKFVANKTMSASLRKIRSMSPDVVIPESNLLDTVRRSIVTSSVQALEVWEVKFSKKKLPVISRMSTFDIPQANNKCFVHWMVFTPCDEDCKGKRIPVTFAKMIGAPTFEAMIRTRKKRDNIPDDLVDVC